VEGDNIMPVNAPVSSPIDIGLPNTPQMVKDPQVYEELLRIYQAIRALQGSIPVQEVGEWTATLLGTVSNPTTPVTVVGRYVKTGKNCILGASFHNVDTTGAAGDVRVGGNPFTAAGTITHFMGVAGQLGFGADPIDCTIISGETDIRIRVNTTTVYITHAAPGAGKYLLITISIPLA
jgi:hypothetical protein